MKKAFLPILLVLFLSMPARSQGDPKFGFQLSPGVSWFNPDMRNVENGARISFEFGAMADIPLLDNIALSTGLGGEFNGGNLRFHDHAVPVADVSGDGKEDRWKNNTYLGKGTYKLRYVKVPLTFKGMTNEIGHMVYFIEFGGALGFNYYARMDVNDDTPFNATSADNISVPKEDYPIKRMVRTFRTSMVIRAGAEYNMTGTTKLVIGATFDNGLSNTFNPNNVATYESDEGKPKLDDNGEPIDGGSLQAITNAISINIGVLF